MAWRVEVTAEFADWARQLRKVDRHSSRQVGDLFVFNPWQQIVLLVAGDKAGDWLGWYRKAIPRADELYAEHIETMSGGTEGGE